VHADKLGQVTNFTRLSTASISTWFCFTNHYCLLGGDTAMRGGLHARLCHAFLIHYTSPPTRVRTIAMSMSVWLSVCPLAYLDKFRQMDRCATASRSVDHRAVACTQLDAECDQQATIVGLCRPIHSTWPRPSSF